MNKVGQLKIDQFDINGTTKTASGNDYALIVRDGMTFYKKFPINNSSEVLESIEAFKKTASELPEELVKVAKYYLNVAHKFFYKKAAFEDVDKVDSNIVIADHIDWNRYNVKMAEKRNKGKIYAFVKEGGEGILDISSEEKLLNGMMWYKKYASRLNNAARKTIAKNMLKRAEELDINPTEYIVKSASDDFDPHVRVSIYARILRTHNVDLKEKYAQLVDEIEKGKVLPDDACERLETLDKINDPHALRGLRDAYDTVYGVTEEVKKEAQKKEVDDERLSKLLKEGVDIGDLSIVEKEILNLR